MKMRIKLFLFNILVAIAHSETLPKFIETDTGINFVAIPKGSFERKLLLPGQQDANGMVHLDQFLMSQHEISWQQWIKVCGIKSASRLFKREYLRDINDADLDFPVVGVNYFEILSFCKILTNQIITDNDLQGVVMLPTEAQWEYVAVSSQDDVSMENTRKNALSNVNVWKVTEGGPNKFNVLNMLGNVSEFARDAYKEELSLGHNPSNTSVDDVMHLKMVIRGGSYFMDPSTARSDYRFSVRPDFGSRYTGFRVVWEP
jgi:formylglycine-generating enzyme required for sulfatase activity